MMFFSPLPVIDRQSPLKYERIIRTENLVRRKY